MNSENKTTPKRKSETRLELQDQVIEKTQGFETTVGNAVQSLVKKKKHGGRKKPTNATSKLNEKSLNTSKDDGGLPAVSIDNAVEALIKKKKRKVRRKQIITSSIVKDELEKTDVNCVNQDEPVAQIKEKFENISESSVTPQDPVGRIIVSRKRKRRRGKMNGEVKNVNVSQTNSNYPKELSANSDISCNWKKLCQTMGAIKAVKSEFEHPPRKLQKSQVKMEFNNQPKQSTSSEIWFDGVDKELLKASAQSSMHHGRKKENVLVKEGSFAGLTNAVAMDCEMVGIGENGTDSMVARVSIVNLMGNCIYDKYVKPTEPVIDYRTPVSGIRPSDLERGEDFKTVQKEVSDMLDKRILIGHAVHNDLKVLFLTHPRKKIRDTSAYKPFRTVSHGNTPSLKKLAEKLLGVKVQEGEHSSVQDAQAAMRLYTMHKIDWENAVKKKGVKKRKSKSEATKAVSAGRKPSSPTTKKFSQLKI